MNIPCEQIRSDLSLDIAMDEVLEEKRVRHIDSFIKEHPEALKITSGANKVIYKEKN